MSPIVATILTYIYLWVSEDRRDTRLQRRLADRMLDALEQAEHVVFFFGFELFGIAA